MKNKLKLSSLGHTWIFDLDGTILKHNGYKTDEGDSFLDGAESFLKNIPEKDMIVFISSRTDEYKDITVNFLKKHKIRYDHIIFNAPYGERIVINDNKLSGLKTSVSVCTERDKWSEIFVEEDESL